MTGYDFWQSALAGNSPPVHDGDAQPGFYRMRAAKGGALLPVAIWEHEGKLVALVDGASSDPARIWNFVCDKPVTEEAYRSRVETGIWFDEDAAVTASLSPPPAGHNDPPQDEADVLSGQIESAAANAQDYVDIKDDETAAKAQSARARLNELSGQADKRREALKKPHLEAGKAVDARWQPIVKRAKEAADALRAALGAYETRKARAAEQARLAAEETRKKALAEQLAAHPEAPPPPLPPPPEAAPVPITAIKGAYGRAATIKEVKRATVTDQDAVYNFLRGHRELVDLIARLAQRAVDAGHTVPGVTVTTEKDVR